MKLKFLLRWNKMGTRITIVPHTEGYHEEFYSQRAKIVIFAGEITFSLDLFLPFNQDLLSKFRDFVARVDGRKDPTDSLYLDREKEFNQSFWCFEGKLIIQSIGGGELEIRGRDRYLQILKEILAHYEKIISKWDDRIYHD